MSTFLAVSMTAFQVLSYLQGSITYHHTFISKNPHLTVESVRYQLKRDSSIYLFSADEYKMVQYYDGKVSATITYDEATRFVYEDLAERDYIVYHDSRKANSLHFPQQIVKDSTINVTGYECYMARITSSFENSTFFYSDQVRTNPDVYADHKAGNRDLRLQEVNGAIPLKFVNEHKDYIEIGYAVSVSFREVAEEEFEVPAAKMLVAAASTLDQQPVINFLTESSHQCYQTILDEIARRYKPEYLPEFVTVTFVVSTSGEILHVEAYDHKGTDWEHWAEKIVSECGLSYSPGLMNGKTVNSQVHLPVSLKSSL